MEMNSKKYIELNLRVRRHENSAHLSVNTSYFLRYGQEMRVHAFGYGTIKSNEKLLDFTTLKPAHVIPVVKAQHLQVYHELFNGTEIVLNAHVTSVGKSTLGLETEVWNAGRTRLYARLLVIIVMKDTETGKAWKLAPDLKEVAQGLLIGATLEGHPVPLLKRLAVPAWERIGDDPRYFHYTFTICYSHLDLNNHVNHAMYLDFVDNARFSKAARAVFGEDISLATSGVEMEYIREVFLDEQVDLVIWLTDLESDLPSLAACLYRVADGTPVNVIRLTFSKKLRSSL